MRTKKLILVLKTFSRKELRTYENYLSARHGRKKEALKIFDYVKKFHPKYEDESLKIDVAFPKIFGKKTPFKSKKLKDLISILYLAMEDFLIQEKLKEATFKKQFMLAEIYRDRNVDKLFFEKIQKSKQALAEQSDKGVNIQWYLKNMRIHHEIFFHPQTNKNKIGIENIELAMENLDLFFEGMKLSYASEMVNRENILNENYKINYSELVMKNVATRLEPSDSKPSLISHHAYFLAYQMLKKKEDQSFHLLKKFFKNNVDAFDFSSQHLLLTYLINFTAIEIKKGKIEYSEDAFELYLIGLEKNIFGKVGYLSDAKFFNIINLACVVKKDNWQNWTRTFIEDWTELLSENIRESAKAIAYGILFFEEEKFEAVLKKLSTVKNVDMYYRLRVQVLTLCSQYELEYQNKYLIRDRFKTFENFIKRSNSLGNENQKSALNLVKYLRKVLRGNCSSKTLFEEIEKTQPLFFKIWLLKKCMA